MTANDLKQWRDRLGITQEEAAILLGVSRPTIARHETGEDVPRLIELACEAILVRFNQSPTKENGTAQVKKHIAMIKAFRGSIS